MRNPEKGVESSKTEVRLIKRLTFRIPKRELKGLYIFSRYVHSLLNPEKGVESQVHPEFSNLKLLRIPKRELKVVNFL